MSAELNPDVAADLDALETEALADLVPGAATPAAPELENLSTVDLCIMTVDMLFAVIAGRRGAHWALSPDESSKLGAATGRVLDKYLPGLTPGPGAALLLAVVVVVAPRLVHDRAPPAGGADGGQPEHSAP